MTFHERLRPKYTMHILNIEDFLKNSDLYQKSFDEISYSLGLNNSNYDEFFKRHPINSIVYIKDGNKIVSFMYATPCRDYITYEGTDLQYWTINYIQTHKDFQNNGYASLLIPYGIQDIVKKGGNKIDFVPNQFSKSILEKAIQQFKIGTLNKSKERIGTLTISINDKNIQKEKVK